MPEVKSVKVDNWGVFFLQKLQNFFNKTDYCDLTLQFADNSQLKVHRLVLSACTDYFNLLEQTYEVIDDTLIMPHELQADVVVPIVNFMYTGTLEFELDMFAKLMKTARDMKMTVLLKLLEAHKRTFDSASHTRQVNTPVTRKYSTIAPKSASITRSNQPRMQQPKQVYEVPKYGRILKSNPTKTIIVQGPSRYECADETILPHNDFESSFDNISYESKPLVKQVYKEEPEYDDYENTIRATTIQTSSPFEQLRQGYSSTAAKRSASMLSSFGSPPDKRPNIQDVKEYAEQQRMRKQIVAEVDGGDGGEYDDVLDDDLPYDDDDEEYLPPVSIQRTVRTAQQQSHKTVGKAQKTEQKSTIVVKDSAGSNVDHTKIISEVLKKYPHLVKNNKNIKLKIMKSSNDCGGQKIMLSEEPATKTEDQSTVITYQTDVRSSPQKSMVNSNFRQPSPAVRRTNNTQIIQQKSVAVQKPATVSQVQKTAAAAIVSPGGKPDQPRRIDSKTMHALIALGAENTTGPWLCLRCGVSGRPISIPSYRGFRRHLINTHKEKIDARLCEHCGWRSTSNKELFHHWVSEHNLPSPKGYVYPECAQCSQILIDDEALAEHIEREHPIASTSTSVGGGAQQCIYCNKDFQREVELYHHMREFHKLRAQKDGVIDFSDDEMAYDEVYEDVGEVVNENEDKIKILSNISLPKNTNLVTGSTITLDSDSQATLSTLPANIQFVGNVAGNVIETGYINPITGLFEKKDPEFVTIDGNLMELTAEQRDEIMSQLEHQHQGGVVMVLNQDGFESGETHVAEDGTITTTAGQNVFVVADNENSVGETLKDVKDKAISETDSQMDWEEHDEKSQSQVSEKQSENDEHEQDDRKFRAEENDANKSNFSEDIHTSAGNNDTATEEEDEAITTADDEDKNEKPKKSAKDAISEFEARAKLKMLTGDWSDDDDDDDEDDVDGNIKEHNDDEDDEDDAIDSKLVIKKEKPLVKSSQRSALEEEKATKVDNLETAGGESSVNSTLEEAADEDEKDLEETVENIKEHLNAQIGSDKEDENENSNDIKEVIKTVEEDNQKEKTKDDIDDEQTHDDEDQEILFEIPLQTNSESDLLEKDEQNVLENSKDETAVDTADEMTENNDDDEKLEEQKSEDDNDNGDDKKSIKSENSVKTEKSVKEESTSDIESKTKEQKPQFEGRSLRLKRNTVVSSAKSENTKKSNAASETSSASTSAKKKETPSKPEVKTLLSDWGDDEEDV